jgi:hypothetical protein
MKAEKINQLFDKIDPGNQREEGDVIIESQLSSLDEGRENQSNGQSKFGKSQKLSETKPAGDSSSLKEGVVSLSCQNPYLKLIGVDLKHRKDKEAKIKLGLTKVEVNERKM